MCPVYISMWCLWTDVGLSAVRKGNLNFLETPASQQSFQQLLWCIISRSKIYFMVFILWKCEGWLSISWKLCVCKSRNHSIIKASSHYHSSRTLLWNILSGKCPSHFGDLCRSRAVLGLGLLYCEEQMQFLMSRKAYNISGFVEPQKCTSPT